MNNLEIKNNAWISSGVLKNEVADLSTEQATILKKTDYFIKERAQRYLKEVNAEKEKIDATGREIKKGLNGGKSIMENLNLTIAGEIRPPKLKKDRREKARQEKELANKLAEQENQGKTHEKDIEIAKYHEERGKIKCDCWQCAESKKLQAEIKEETTEEEKAEKSKCSECGKMVKKLDEENGVCKKCLKEYGGVNKLHHRADNLCNNFGGVHKIYRELGKYAEFLKNKIGEVDEQKQDIKPKLESERSKSAGKQFAQKERNQRKLNNMNNELNNNIIKKFSGLNICPNEGSKNQKTEYQEIQSKINSAYKWQQISKSQQKKIKARIGEEIIELYEAEQIELNEKILECLEDLKD
ncbi:4591_t:CDS:2 [Entrophospora sp. SA101]|nr:4591_t:CDS:2 [Entrophospora sp. SA101]